MKTVRVEYDSPDKCLWRSCGSYEYKKPNPDEGDPRTIS